MNMTKYDRLFIYPKFLYVYIIDMPAYKIRCTCMLLIYVFIYLFACLFLYWFDD